MKPTHIVIHCSATKDSGTVSWDAIRDYHVNTLGWKDIGYHFGVEQIGDQYEVLVGRLPNVEGAHCSAAGMNHKSIGVCCVGSFDDQYVPDAQWEKCLAFVRWLQEVYHIPTENITGHREVESRKTCPGLYFDMDLFRNSL